MKNWMIKNWLFNYDTKVFGTTFRHLRVVNTLMPLFVFAGVINLLTEGLTLIDIILFIPFFAIFFGRSWLIGDWNINDLDWEQKFQYYQSTPDNMLPSNLEDLKELKQLWVAKYKGSEKFVEAFRFFLPLICMVGALLIIWLFGSSDNSFPDLRGF